MRDLLSQELRSLDYLDPWWTDQDEDAYQRLVEAWSQAPDSVAERFIEDIGLNPRREEK